MDSSMTQQALMNKDKLLDILVGRRGYKARWPWRVVAGLLAAVAVAAWIVMLRAVQSPNWVGLLVGAYISFLLLFVAITGRMPRWLQPGRSKNMERWSRE